MMAGKTDPNPESNPTLRSAIQNAKADNVPNDNITRILKKLSGEGKDGAEYQEMLYEGYAPGGIPVMVSAITENVNRTFPELRLAFGKAGGTLGQSGSVGYMFDHVGVITLPTDGRSEDAVLELALDAGAEDIVYDAEESLLITAFTELSAVETALQAQGVTVSKSTHVYRAKDPQQLSDAAVIEKIEKFLDRVNEVEDVDEISLGAEW